MNARDDSQSQDQLEQEIYEALDRVAQGDATVSDATLLAAASGVRWKPKNQLRGIQHEMAR